MHEIDDALRARLDELCAEGSAIWERFDTEVRDNHFHPFIASDYGAVLKTLLAHRGPGLRFLELGSATGVITIMADLLGFDAYGIELDSDLVTTARGLAAKYGSGAQFVAGSFVPTGFRWKATGGDGLADTFDVGVSAYLEIGYALDDFHVVFGYPWESEVPTMHNLMKDYGRRDALLLVNDFNDRVRAYRGGREVTGGHVGGTPNTGAG